MILKDANVTARLYPLRRHLRFGTAVLAASLLIQSPASAQYYSLSTGTGFFVSKYGYVVTNAHVVEDCQRITVQGSVKESEAELMDVDEDIDLALLKTDAIPPYVASIRSYGSRIGKGDGVLVIGYPGERALTGEYSVVDSEVVAVHGPGGEKKWLQFNDSAQKGNSGGPLLDISGNVVGVVTAKTSYYAYDTTAGGYAEKQGSDLAISLPYLEDFLEKNRVLVWKAFSDLNYNRVFIENKAKQYIVNIRCFH